MNTTLLPLDDTRRQIRDRLRTMPHSGEPQAATLRLRALLQEMGVHCDDTAELDDADAILLTSGRGMEALIASRLDDEQRHHAYSRIVARLIIGQMHEPIDQRSQRAYIFLIQFKHIRFIWNITLYRFNLTFCKRLSR